MFRVYISILVESRRIPSETYLCHDILACRLQCTEFYLQRLYFGGCGNEVYFCFGWLSHELFEVWVCLCAPSYLRLWAFVFWMFQFVDSLLYFLLIVVGDECGLCYSLCCQCGLHLSWYLHKPHVYVCYWGISHVNRGLNDFLYPVGKKFPKLSLRHYGVSSWFFLVKPRVAFRAAKKQV